MELPFATVSYDEPVVIFIYKKDAELGFPEIRQLVQHAELLSGGKPYVTFSDVREGVTITEQGKRYVSDPDNMKLFRGTAIFVKNEMVKLAANFMKHFQNHRFPFRAFTDEKAAMRWLKKLPLE